MQTEGTYNDVINLKYPEQVVLAIVKDAQGKYNPIALGWTMITSHNPPMMAVGLGRTRYSLEAIRQAGEFVIAMPSEDQEAETMLFGTKSGRDMDKLAAAKCSVSPATKIDCVILDAAVANFECRLVGEMETGDHVLLVGEVVACHRNTLTLNRLYTCAPGHTMGGLPRKE
jgi:flavin reductase (DIM6/NTAB) family NADH-FMN oxidoreductase RutF